MLRYHSTNRRLPGGFRAAVPFAEALFLGLAPDDGLFLPVSIPELPLADLPALRGSTYAAVASTVLRRFLEPELDGRRIDRICEDAYDFDVPLEPLEEGIHLLRLDRGPTASFKDFAARFMARVMSELRPAANEVVVLVATSGDTGAAVGEAFRGIPGTRVHVLYPADEVSPVQRRTLDGLGANVRTWAVSGTFDDCQRLVKQALADPALARLGVTSANSINIGRVLPQVVFYVRAWIEVGGGPLVVSVPSGNLGNSLGCEIARRMGVPIDRLILATNANDEVVRFLRSGRYEALEPSHNCLSNAMNVGNPSNLARYFDLYGGTLTKEGTIREMPDLAAMQAHLHAVSITDAQTIETMRQVWRERGVLLEPHGAVGLCALREYLRTHAAGPSVCLETAHPAKFPEIVERELGLTPEPTAALVRLAARTGAARPLQNRYEEFRDALEEES